MFAALHSFRKDLSLMERMEILAIGVERFFEPSLKNLSARLSLPVALMALNSFNIFRINIELTFSNFRFFHES